MDSLQSHQLSTNNQANLPKPIIYILGLGYWPIAVIYSLALGMFGGLFFSILGTFQKAWRSRYAHQQLWRKYPYISYENFIDEQMARYRIEHKIDWISWGAMYLFIRKKMELDNPEEPEPSGGSDIFEALFFLPFSMIAGMVYGVGHVFERCMDVWKVRVLNRHPYEKFAKKREKYEKEYV